jgi:hypothetical protein
VAALVPFEFVQHGNGMSLVDQDSVEEFAANAADEALGDGIGPGRTHWRPDDFDLDGGEDSVEGGGELGDSIVEEKPEPLAGVVEVYGQVPGLLGQPRSRWPGGGGRGWRVDRAWQALWSSGGRRIGGASAESWPV